MKIMFLRHPGALAAFALCAVLVLLVGTGALAASSNVVPPKGKVAGHGYAYWMQRHWQFAYGLTAAAAQSPNVCHVLTANGTKVAWLSGPVSKGRHTCSEPVGRPVYVNLSSVACDTFKGEHPGFGTSDAQLQLCSKKYFAQSGTPTATVDGQTIDVTALVTGTGGFPIHAVAGNPIGVPAGNGRAAAYGVGLLFSGFSKGTHTIHCAVGDGEDLTWVVRVS